MYREFIEIIPAIIARVIFHIIEIFLSAFLSLVLDKYLRNSIRIITENTFP